ncbi:MAG TPA: carboxypeptidase-like regulatory domain-containing protein [Flavobacteriaceae bacterium]|nr:carboxypeptidase-like regulatory domain-containing protein [Flavobacteriaceae bacterium]
MFVCFIGFQSIEAKNTIEIDTARFTKYKGIVIDSKTKKPLEFATLTINTTNISTITNTQGKFSLKVPKIYTDKSITVSYLGYTSQIIKLKDLDNKKNTIRLETHIEQLSEVNISIKDAESLLKKVLKSKNDNYFGSPTTMTAFYRETIKKRNTYVSLTEAVVEINKHPYTSGRNDFVKLYKSRKSTNYKKLDTLTLKLRGGPFSTLRLDVMKNPTLLFTDNAFENYNFYFQKSTKIDNKPIYVLRFEQKKKVKDPLFYGKLYIDANTYALTNAEFSLNLKDQKKAAPFFILKKPKKAEVLPIKADYRVDYRVKNGKWYYGYSRIDLGFKIDWDKRWFNSVYYSSMEMAITDWKINENKDFFKPKNRLKRSVIMSDEASGFSDPDFWGEYNVIEPEKPIENAIKKIQRQLKRL